MQKLLFPFIFGLAFIFSSCHSAQSPVVAPSADSGDVESIFPVTNFLKGQLREMDSAAITPLKIVTVNGKIDSTWLKREDLRPIAAPFLTPLIDSATMTSLFSEKSFLDQTINAYTFSYDPKVKMPDSIKLTHWDVYMNPQTNTVTRVYMVKESAKNNADTTTQLTWLVNKWYSIRTIAQQQGKQPEIKEVKMIWNFDD